MDQADFEKYVNGRYQDQVDWYDRKAQVVKKQYTLVRYGLIFLAALTPILIAVGGMPTPWGWAAIIVSALVAIGTAVLRTFKYEDPWRHYRSVCESLRKEIHFYQWGVDPFEKTDNPQRLFVSRVESLISRHNTISMPGPDDSEVDETRDMSGN